MYFTLEFGNLHHRFRLVLALGLHFGVRSGFSLMRAWDMKTEHNIQLPSKPQRNFQWWSRPYLFWEIYIYLLIYFGILSPKKSKPKYQPKEGQTPNSLNSQFDYLVNPLHYF